MPSRYPDEPRLLPEDWDPRGPIALKTKAKDNHGHSYTAYVENSGKKTFPRREENFVLGIEGAPGAWYMGTLLESERAGHFRNNIISLDFGQNWNLINFSEVLAEAKKVLKISS